MNQEKIGKFIAELRKEKKLTQEQLGQRLGVSSKSISRWENGKSMPDLSLLVPISQEFNISVNELLSGERIIENNYQQNFENNIVEIFLSFRQYINHKMLKLFISILIIICLGLILGIMSFITITEYLNYPVAIKKENITFEICDYNEDFYKITFKTNDSLGAHRNSQKDFDKKMVTFTLYRTRLENKNDRLLDGYGIGNELIEKSIESFYYDSELIWNKSMKINKCN